MAIIFGESNSVSIQWLAAAMQTARRVGRVEIGDRAFGTGFLLDANAIEPSLKGPPLFLTRDFVLAPNASPFAVGVRDLEWHAGAVVFQAPDGSSAFTRHRFTAPVAFVPALHLVALVLESPPQTLRTLDIAPDTPERRQPVYILGYPLGGGMRLALRDNECLGVEELHGAPQLLYRAETQPGSSGSPVLNDRLEVTAVHLGGDRKRGANYGTPIGPLLQGLRNALRTPAEGIADYSTLLPAYAERRDRVDTPCSPSQEYYSAFLSYSHDDRPFAARLFEELRSLGVAVWWDQVQMRIGDDIYARINEMRRTDKVILCCSESSLNSLWVDNELKLALSKERKLREQGSEATSIVLPLDLDGYLKRWKGPLSAQFVSRNYADFVGWADDDTKFREGVRMVAHALEIEKREEDFPEPKLG